VLLTLPLTLSAAGCKHGSDAAEHGTPTGEAEKEKEPFGRLTVEALEARMADAKAGKASLAIFDTNQRERYAQSHIATAKWVKSNAVTAADLPADKDTTLVFYCSNDH
jgi:3-mercaptopyruvate sulfurtransferase SseA